MHRSFYLTMLLLLFTLFSAVVQASPLTAMVYRHCHLLNP